MNGIALLPIPGPLSLRKRDSDASLKRDAEVKGLEYPLCSEFLISAGSKKYGQGAVSFNYHTLFAQGAAQDVPAKLTVVR